MKWFTMDEMLYSDTARQRGIENIPTAEQRKNIIELVETLLDPLREAYGKPIQVTSGFRCDALNKAVGGSATSAHSVGFAADLQPCGNDSIEELVAFAKDFLRKSHLAFDQLIDERSGETRWLHLGLKDRQGKQRRQMMRYANGRYSTMED